MSLSPLIPVAGTALGVIAGRTIDAVKDGLSFLDVLRQDAADGETTEQAAPPNADPNQLVALLQEHFSRLGIGTSVPVHLKQDGRGGVIVDQDHPDRVLIEGLFNSDEELTDLFNGLAAAIAEEAPEGEQVEPEDFRLIIDSIGGAIGFA